MKRLHVLISSHEFSPEQGSECAVGWNIVTRMAAYHDVTVLCADGPALNPNTYRDAIARYVNQHGAISGLRVVYVAQPPATMRYARLNQKLMALTKGIGWQPLYYIGLDGWHREAFKTADKIGFENFDVVHQLTPISFLKPGYLWSCKIPFFWGPLGGMYKVPSAFAKLGGIKSQIFEVLRSVNIERLVRTAHFQNVVRKAYHIWAVTEDERRIVDAISYNKVTPLIDTSPHPDIVGRCRKYDGQRPLRLCWSGQHEPRKALPLLLNALSHLPKHQQVILDVLGDGPETLIWQGIAKHLSLSAIVWHGRLSYADALQVMGRADVFVHSSYREAASTVVLEALGWGMPVICHDACGMAIAVDDTCGIKVPFVNPERSIQGFRDALERIFNEPGLVEKLSEGALRRASVLTWDAKVREMANAYTLAVD